MFSVNASRKTRRRRSTMPTNDHTPHSNTHAHARLDTWKIKVELVFLMWSASITFISLVERRNPGDAWRPLLWRNNNLGPLVAESSNQVGHSTHFKVWESSRCEGRQMKLVCLSAPLVWTSTGRADHRPIRPACTPPSPLSCCAQVRAGLFVPSP